MKRKTVSINSLILLLSLISLIVEVSVFYLTQGGYVTVIVSWVLALAITHFCLETSYDYNYGFVNVVFMLVSSTIFAGALYLFGNDLIQYKFSLVYMVLGNWVFPFVYSLIRYVADVGDRFTGFRKYFRKMIILFLVFYALILIKQYFVTPIKPPYASESFGAHNFIPYMSTGQYIENTVKAGTELRTEMYFLLELLFLGLPAGFLISYSWRTMHILLRIILYIAIPTVFELAQYAYGVGTGSIDDVCTFVIGEVIGIILFHLLDIIFEYVHKRHFMEPRDAIKSYFDK
ncbi:MAG: VanZ family protein [Lachnospiraceae bacterium]|nr:VanZ family protein [Lachnospiraceae bacterium]